MPRRKPEDIQDILVRILDERTPVTGPGKRKTATKREAILLQILQKAEEGHRAAIRILLQFQKGNPQYNDAFVEGFFSREELNRKYGAAIHGTGNP